MLKTFLPDTESEGIADVSNSQKNISREKRHKHIFLPNLLIYSYATSTNSKIYFWIKLCWLRSSLDKNPDVFGCISNATKRKIKTIECRNSYSGRLPPMWMCKRALLGCVWSVRVCQRCLRRHAEALEQLVAYSFDMSGAVFTLPVAWQPLPNRPADEGAIRCHEGVCMCGVCKQVSLLSSMGLTSSWTFATKTSCYVTCQWFYTSCWINRGAACQQAQLATAFQGFLIVFLFTFWK